MEPTINCSLLSSLLIVFININVEIFPIPIPSKMKYWYADGIRPMARNGPAQHKPFMTFAIMGHSTLRFILFLMSNNEERNLANIIPNVIPKHAIQIRRLKISEGPPGVNSSINIVPDNKATDIAIKRTPNALLANAVSRSLFNNC